MAEHEVLIARLNLIAQDAAKLDSRARQEVLDATISCSAKLLAHPSTDQSDALNEPHVQPIYLLPFQTGDRDTSAVTVPPKWDIIPGDHENPPWAAVFSQQSAEISPSSFVPPYERESLNYSPMGMYCDQQHIQNSHFPTIQMDHPFDWSKHLPNHSLSMPGTVAHGSLNDSYRMPTLTDEMNNPLALHPTCGLWNDFDPVVLFGSSADTTTIADSTADSLTINLFNSSHNSSYRNDIGHLSQHLIRSATDQLEPGFGHLNSSFTRPVAHLDVDSCIFQEPVGIGTFSRGEEPPTPRTFQRLKFHGRITTPDSYLTTNTYDTRPASITSGADFDCDLPCDRQQRLCGELKATNVGSLPGRSESGKPGKAIRKKKALSPEERRRITETRHIGACYLCNRDRRKCSGPKGSCTYCMKTVGSLLASHICLTGLQIHWSKFNTELFFGSYNMRYQGEVYNHIRNLSSGHSVLGYLAIDSSKGIMVETFKVQVSDKTNSLSERPLQHTGTFKLGLLDPNNLRAHSNSSPVSSPVRLEVSIDAFLGAYCNISPCLPMRDCAMAVLKFVRGVAVGGSTQQLIRSTRKFEKELLGTLDEYMNSESNRRFPNPTMLGLCVRRLSLYYRGELISFNYFKTVVTNGEGPPEKLSNYWRWIREYQETLKSMHDACISAYSKIYHKGKSPYSLRWRLQDHIEEFGNDAALVKMFEEIRTQERKFCEALDENDEDNKVLRELFLKPKQRGEKSWDG